MSGHQRPDDQRVDPHIGSPVDQQAEVDAYLQTYRDLMGFVPERIRARFDALRTSDPELLLAQERVRHLVAYHGALDQRTTQLILFAVLVVQMRDAAGNHGVAALRAGASREELQSAIDLAYLFGGVSVANSGPSVLEGVAELEARTAEQA